MSRLCPACAGVLGPDAQWCGMCHADLRPPGPVPAAARDARPVPAPVDADPVDDGPRAEPDAPAGPRALVVLPLVDPPAPVGAVQPGWPCTGCSTLVPYEADACPVCGAGFLAALTGSGLPRLPVVGTPRRGRGRLTWVLAAVFLGGLTALLVLALSLAGRASG